MKVVFTIVVGVVSGWAIGVCDEEGQLALEQHQVKVNDMIYQAATQEVEEESTITSVFFVWP